MSETNAWWTPARRRTISWILIALGVLAWAPFIYLTANGRPASIWPFLGAHLVGVLTGEWLRDSARRLEGLAADDPATQRRKLISTIMIYVGVLTMVTYVVLTRVLKQDYQIAPFLTVHLLGLFGGAALRVNVELERRRRRA